MTSRSPAVSYLRSGGRPPADDERLEVDADGQWRLWRTMGGTFTGSFEGRLSADRRRRLEAAVRSASEPAAGRRKPARRPAPDGAHEAIAAGAHRIDVASHEAVDEAWTPLVRLLRRWSETLANAGNADRGLELAIDDGAPRLVRHGSGTLRVWPATLHVEAYGRDADSVVRDRAANGPGAEADGPRGEPITTEDGWVLELGLPRAVAVPAGGRLETWAWLDVDGPDGIVRTRLVAARPG